MKVNDMYVVDAETTLHNETVGKFKASPHSKDNWIVYLGATQISPTTLDPLMAKPSVAYNLNGKVSFNAFSKETMLIGHNIGYDLLFLCNPSNPKWREWRAWLMGSNALIWDTQLAHYRLTGQTAISPTLDSVAEYYGLPMKPNGIKEYWKNGVSTEDIPENEIVPYLRHDVSVTALIFKRQILEANKKGMLPMLRHEMRSRLTTIVMECNGVHFDDDMATERLTNVITPLRNKYEQEAHRAGMLLTGLKSVAVNPSSPKFLSAVLYGGEVKWKDRQPIMDPVTGQAVLFKTGKNKGEVKKKWVDCSANLPQLGPKGFKAGTDAKQLKAIQENAKCSTILDEFLTAVLNFRDAQKQEKTYFKGYADLTWEDGMIHPNLNHAITATGRLSCTNP